MVEPDKTSQKHDSKAFPALMDHGMQLYINGRASVSTVLIFSKIKSLKIRNKHMHFTAVGDITKMTNGNNIAFLSNDILTPVT